MNPLMANRALKKLVAAITLTAAAASSFCAHAEPPSLGDLLKIQQSVNSMCLIRGQGRARMLCRCAAVVVSQKVAVEGAGGFQAQPEAMFEQAFEACTAHEDKGFFTATAKLYQSKSAIEESLRANEPKP